MLSPHEQNAGRVPRYYEDLGMAHDYVVRCKDCQKILLFEVISSIGCCDNCGNKRYAEITTLTDAEQELMKTLDFPHKEKFLAEFKTVEV